MANMASVPRQSIWRYTMTERPFDLPLMPKMCSALADPYAVLRICVSGNQKLGACLSPRFLFTFKEYLSSDGLLNLLRWLYRRRGKAPNRIIANSLPRPAKALPWPIQAMNLRAQDDWDRGERCSRQV
jgi:hypothetical protein